MRRDTRDVLLAWVIGTFALIAMCVAMVGCDVVTPTEAEESYSTVERALVDNTARFSAELGVRVRGEITSKLHPSFVAANIVAAAWFEKGVAYYYRPQIEKYVRLVPTPGMETAANIAAHEVCHSKHPDHDLAHWTCNDTLADPTYPRPGSAPND